MRKDIAEIIAKLHPLEKKVLPALEKATAFHEIVGVTGLQEVEVMRALQWLQNKGVLQLDEEIQELVELDENGKQYAEKGLPEKHFLNALEAAAGVSLQTIQELSRLDRDELTVSLGILKKKNAVAIQKEGKELVVSLTEEGKSLMVKEHPEERFLRSLQYPRDMQSLTAEEKGILSVLGQRRKLVKTTVVKLRSVQLTQLGKELLTNDFTVQFKDHITQEMLKTGEWKHAQFRHYDVTINVPPIAGGKRHIVSQAISYIKQIWLDMGFVEMTGAHVQMSYWDLDSLFVPQDHPARQMQDTFFLADSSGKGIARGKLPADYAKIQATHETGGKTGSSGWQQPWHKKEAEAVLLRTHTTVLSVLQLAELGKEQKLLAKKLPLKFFNVGRVFRNEALDWKHLFEFHQVDGIVIDPHANLKHLKAYLRQFFGKMGYPKIRMRPAYFPYTEPSLEVEAWHPKKQQWVELGGAGIFRPEVVVPFLGEDIPVLAWGLGLERIISDYYHLTDIRDLYRNDIQQLQNLRIWVK